MQWGVIETLAAVGILLLLLYYYFTSTYNFWISRNVPGPKPLPFFGNLKDVLFNKKSLGDLVTSFYQKYKDQPMFGIFANRNPVLIVNDPELIKDVLIKDFSSFSDRGFTIFEKIEPLSQHLFLLEPERWRPLRINLSPAFTSGKLKQMFYLLMECADHFEEFLDKYVKKDPVIECRDLTAKFTTDVIGVCAFGLKMNSLAEEDSEFRKIGRLVFETSNWRLLKLRLKDAIPWLYQLLGPYMYEHQINDFFIESIKQTIAYRKQNNVTRNDFVDILMEIQNNPSKVNDIEMTDILIAAQAFVFFVAGFETSSTTISHALYELALNPSIQSKLREEIKEELKKNNGELKYESIKNMKYMHKVFCETLRKYPPVSILLRSTVEKYTFSKTNVTIPKGMKVWIPVYAIQRDPDIYPNPDAFDPERFEDDVAKQRHPSYYLPFGDGPRNCIGSRFANYQSKVGLIKILNHYKVDVCDETCIPYVNNPRSFLLQPIGGIKLKFSKIN